MEVAQPEGHLEKNGAAGLCGEGSVHVQVAAEGGGKVLHHQLGQLGACLYTHAQELDYVRVVELAKQLTLCSKPDVGGGKTEESATTMNTWSNHDTLIMNTSKYSQRGKC